ncbi:hypothetical protein Tsubulata_002892 [Turnera subulata]|uniref:Peptidase A1 domain-containing protein n=1 Tax=Turnera subulata TaxID=218843 RepID=A0A9Q0G765_9ROSI|nr:hypothetical protein Tsubulata_002892 [Turnera subulata]
MYLLPFFFFFLLITSFCITQVSSQLYHALVAPIHKDHHTSLYTIALTTNNLYDYNYFVVDINAPFSWDTCEYGHYPIACTSQECNQGRTYLSPLCQSSNNLVDGQCYCNVTATNPVTNMCASSQMTYKSLVIAWTNGDHPSVHINFNNVYLSCAPTSFLGSFPYNVTGLASLSWSPLSLTTQFTPSNFEMSRMFAICLPGKSRPNGVVFFGDGPYYLMHFPSDIILSYTPLIRRDNVSAEYYIGVEKILIQGDPLKLKDGTFDFDSSGNGGVMLSTMVPYSILRSDIYHAFLKSFSKATHSYPTVDKIDPFGLCFNTTELKSTRVGLPFPQIDLALSNGTSWTMFGANSMKKIRKGVACLAFVDGGMTAKQAVVMGSHQLENNFLQFDLDTSRLGFSSSLLFRRTNCGNFNFTSDSSWG